MLVLSARLGWLACAALLGCSGERVVIDVVAPIAVVVRVEGGVARQATLHADLRASPLPLELGPRDAVYVLEYDAPIDDFVVVDAGNIALAPEGGADIDGRNWPLPPPVGRAVWRGDDAPGFDVATLRVARPRCPELSSAPISDPALDLGLSMLLPLGEGALIGTWVPEDSGEVSRVLYRGPDGALEAVAGLTWTSTAHPPFGFADAAGVSVWAPLPEDRASSGLYDVALDRSVSGPLRTSHGRAFPTAFVGGRFGDRRVVVGRFVAANDVWLLAPPDPQWRVAYRGTTTLTTCGTTLRPLLLELPARDRLLAGVGDGRILEIDLTTGVGAPATDLEPPRPTCRNGRLLLPSGVELFYYQGGTDQALVVEWRRGSSGARAPLYTATLLPTAATTWGAYGVLAIEGQLYLVEDEPRRPEIPPRLCGPYRADAEGHLLLARGEELLVGAHPQVRADRRALARVTRVP